MSELVKISIRIPQDLSMWIEGEVARKREKGVRSSTTDEIVTCIVHRIISRLPMAKRKNLCRAMGIAADVGGEIPDETVVKAEQPELMDVVSKSV